MLAVATNSQVRIHFWQQPLSRTRFRYVDSTKSQQDRCILLYDCNGQRKNLEIVVNGSHSGRNYVMFASCVDACNQSLPHANFLVSGSGSQSCKNGVFRRDFKGSNKSFTVQLDCGIQQSDQDKAQERYETKLSALESGAVPLVPPGAKYKVEDLLLENSEFFKNMDLKAVRIYVSVYEKEQQATNGEQLEYAAECTSNPIQHGNCLQIIDTIPSTLYISNPDKLTLLTSEFQVKDGIRVWISNNKEFKDSKDSGNCWKELCQSANHGNKTITVITPIVSAIQNSPVNSAVRAYICYETGGEFSAASDINFVHVKYPHNMPNSDHQLAKRPRKILRHSYHPFFSNIPDCSVAASSNLQTPSNSAVAQASYSVPSSSNSSGPSTGAANGQAQPPTRRSNSVPMTTDDNNDDLPPDLRDIELQPFF